MEARCCNLDRFTFEFEEPLKKAIADREISPLIASSTVGGVIRTRHCELCGSLSTPYKILLASVHTPKKLRYK